MESCPLETYILGSKGGPFLETYILDSKGGPFLVFSCSRLVMLKEIYFLFVIIFLSEGIYLTGKLDYVFFFFFDQCLKKFSPDEGEKEEQGRRWCWAASPIEIC